MVIEGTGAYWWMLASCVAGIYCVVRAIADLRQRRYIWGAIGLISGAVLLLTPVQPRAVKIDLPVSTHK